MGILLFLLYFLLASWFILRQEFFRQTGIKPRYILAIFWIKLAAGAAYGWLFTRMPDYRQQADTWRLFFYSVEELQWLKADPAAWFLDLVTPRYAHDTGLTGTTNSFLNDLKDVWVVKIMTLCNLLSGSRYYINLIFFNTFTCFGPVALAVLWTRFARLPHAGMMLAFICLWPSVLFWTSGFHRDGMLLHGIGWCLWLTYSTIKRGSITPVNLLSFVFHIGLVFICRNYIALLLLTGMGLAGLCFYRPAYRRSIVLSAIILAVLGLWLAGKTDPHWSVAEILAKRQEAYLQLEGRSKMEPVLQQHGYTGLLAAFPVAIVRSMISPPVGSTFQKTDLIFMLENLLWLLGIFTLMKPRLQWPGSASRSSWMIMAITLVVPTLLLIGYTIPFSTAIVRYKAILWPFMTPVLVSAACLQIRKKRGFWFGVARRIKMKL